MGSPHYESVPAMLQDPAERASAARDAIRARVISCPAAEALKQHSKEFEKKIYKVTDGVHVAVGYALANSILIEAPEGVIVVDTTESKSSMEEIWREFRQISDKPLKGIIYSHSHEDHVGGTAALVTPDEEHTIEVWAHSKFMAIKDTYDSLLRGVMLPRNLRQFGVPLERIGGLINCGIGPRGDPNFNIDGHLVWPNRFMTKPDTQDITIAGLDLQLVYIPGETLCQMGVWIPSKKVFLPGDNFYRTFPNLYAIRGTVPRIVTYWIKSLDRIRHMRPEFLVPAHTKPLTGEDYIFETLTNYRDGIQFVHDQTLRLMNRGLHPVEISKAVKLPTSLQKDPYLQSFYGTPEWSSRAVYDAYIGWFSGVPEDLFPLTPKQRGQKMMESFRAETILNVAESALESKDYQWALELSSHIFIADPLFEKAKELRTQAILELASKQTSANGRNYLLTYLLEDHGAHPRRFPSASVVLEMPVNFVFKRMAFELKAEEVDGVTCTIVMNFTDISETYTLHVRNCVLEYEVGHTADVGETVEASMESNCLRYIMAGMETPEQLVTEGKILLKYGDVHLLNHFFHSFETGDELVTKQQVCK